MEMITDDMEESLQCKESLDTLEDKTDESEYSFRHVVNSYIYYE